MPANPNSAPTLFDRALLRARQRRALKLGPAKVVPYGMLDLTQYTSDIDHNDVGRIWGAIGTRAIHRAHVSQARSG